jgi:hypothetical protein
MADRYDEIIKRLREATGPLLANDAMDAAETLFTHGEDHRDLVLALSGSNDAADALTRRLLPEGLSARLRLIALFTALQVKEAGND